MRAHFFITAPWREPADVLAAFADEPFALGLLSGGGGPRGRWSYLARAPDAFLILGATDRRDPFEALRSLLGEPLPAAPDGPPFQGGVAALCAYDLADRLEPLDLGRLGDWPDLACARYPALLAFDHEAQQIVAIGRGADDAKAEARALEAAAWLAQAAPQPAAGPLAAEMEGEPPERYQAAVAEVVERIAQGEIFQANIARRWRGRLAAGSRPFDLLARLIGQSPAPFAAYMRLPGLALVSNSPERFVQVTADGRSLKVETRPIKGTIRRGATPAQDTALAAELAASAKDRAENLMIVDLMRNDLARVSAPGTVRTPKLFEVETFANVHHLVSAVEGELAAGRTAVDLLRAAFPPGSITGAPKVQAMRVIAGLEPPRGPFFGSMALLGFDGSMDSSVLIRTVALTESEGGWRFEARAGGGIVADSEPAAELQETEAKFAALQRALTAD
ncbi:anthranilate synthase component I family protein [Phenylobacterium montanum]|uniref:Anthranilate synthase component I family protein n=1 Tax=Phenylobacterium montanum TaxID=2823693 RepID=A0A975G0B7_9CAUL|nr:anthranilate synthase component I family protein [Caulobacter sp. S6]QUD88760.1 anthranilate synthase component I family protein [Caulobacter sp. S6]